METFEISQTHDFQRIFLAIIFMYQNYMKKNLLKILYPGNSKSFLMFSFVESVVGLVLTFRMM
jgi:hypothetical protein